MRPHFDLRRPPFSPLRPRTAPQSLPLGIDVGSDEVIVLQAAWEGNEVHVKRVGRRAHQGDPAAATTQLLRELEIGERRCILAAPALEMQILPWSVPTGFPSRYLDDAATFKVETGESEELGGRVVRHEIVRRATDGSSADTRVVVTTRSAHIRDLEEYARTAGLDLVAVDSPALAWLRVVSGGIIDDRTRSPFVTLLAKDGPLLNILPFQDDAFPSALKTIVSTASAARPLELAHLWWAGDPTSRYDAARTRLKEIGVTLEPISLFDYSAPYWGFAYALATWSWN